VLSVRDEAPGVRSVVLDCETSRQLVPLQSAYCQVGQRAQVKVQGLEPEAVPPASPPFPAEGAQGHVLWKLKGDLFAHEVKEQEEAISVRSELHLLAERQAAPLTFALQAGEEVELGPFRGGGMPLVGDTLQHVWAHPTVVLLAEGPAGIAAARALLEAGCGPGGVCLGLRDEVRLFYKVERAADACFQELYGDWERDHGAKVTVHTGSFLEAWDEDDELEYDPAQTAVVVFGGEEAEEAARELCQEADVEKLVYGFDEGERLKFLDSTDQV